MDIDKTTRFGQMYETQEHLARKAFWLAGGWLLVALIVYLSLVPHPPQPLSFSGVDKLEHAVAYASVSLWFCQIYLSVRQRGVVVAVLMALGITLEFVQGWGGYRMFEIADMVANSIGALLGLLLVHTPLGRSLARVERLWRKQDTDAR